MTSRTPLPDLFREPERRHPTWLRILFVAVALVFFAAGVVGWLIPVVTGLPFYAVGLVFLGLASDRARRWVNRLERRLAADGVSGEEIKAAESAAIARVDAAVTRARSGAAPTFDAALRDVYASAEARP